VAGRSGDTFKKRQKEVARAEKHREKLARRLERKQNKQPEDDSEGSGGLAVDEQSDEQSSDEQSEDVAPSKETSQLG
jgi:hypothetical protein